MHIFWGRMCNLYSNEIGQQPTRAGARALSDRTGNLLPLAGIFPDAPALILRNQRNGRKRSDLYTEAKRRLTAAGLALQGI